MPKTESSTSRSTYYMLMLFTQSLAPLVLWHFNSKDGKHVVFGKVISGLSVVTAIEQVGSDSGRTRVPGMKHFLAIVMLLFCENADDDDDGVRTLFRVH